VLWHFASKEGKTMLKHEGSMKKSTATRENNHASSPNFWKEGASTRAKMTTINLCESKEGKNCTSMNEV